MSDQSPQPCTSVGLGFVNRRKVLAAIAIATFLLSGWAVFKYPVETFYFPVTRAWELLMGSLLAICLQKKILPEAASNTLAWIGITLVIGSIVLLSSENPFPGFTAFPVCLGTALLLYAGTGGASTFVGKGLQLPFVVFTGLISYSLYLWHWPALAFAKYYLIRPLTAVELAVLLAVVYGLSVLSWRFVERPVRDGTILRSRRALFTATFIGLAAFSAAGTAIILSDGAPSRLPGEVVQLDGARFGVTHSDCPKAPGALFGGMCKIGSGTVSFVVWGDSHSSALRPAFQRAAKAVGSSGLVFTANGCAPLIGLDRKPAVRQQNDCRKYNERTLRLIRDSGVRTVFLAANWPEYQRARYYKNGDLVGGLAATLQALDGLTVHLVTRVPGGREDVASALAREKLFGTRADIELTPQEVEQIQRPVRQMFAGLAHMYGVELFQTAQYLCTRRTCPVIVDGRPLYSDAHHVTPAAADYLAPPLEKLLQR